MIENPESNIDNLDGKQVLVLRDYYTARVQSQKQIIFLSKPFDPERDILKSGHYAYTSSSLELRDIKQNKTYCFSSVEWIPEEISQEDPSLLVRGFQYEAFSLID